MTPLPECSASSGPLLHAPRREGFMEACASWVEALASWSQTPRGSWRADALPHVPLSFGGALEIVPWAFTGPGFNIVADSRVADGFHAARCDGGSGRPARRSAPPGATLAGARRASRGARLDAGAAAAGGAPGGGPRRPRARRRAAVRRPRADAGRGLRGAASSRLDARVAG